MAGDSVGLLGGTVLGISGVAPAYALTATIGLVVAVAGVKMPIIFIAGFLPMFFAAYAYREFNKVDPDLARRSPGPPGHSVRTSAGSAAGSR